MITYTELLEKSGIISEENFNVVIKVIPEFDYSNMELETADVESEDDLCLALMREFINSVTKYAWIDNLNFNILNLEIWDISSYEELDNIESKLNNLGWKIVNRDDIIEELNDYLGYNEESSLRKEISEKITNLSLDELKKLNEKL